MENCFYGTPTFRSTFGRLYEWLAYRKVEDEALEPLRDMIRDMLIDLVPVGAGEVVLGRKISERRRHSIHSAAEESGLHPKTLRKALKHLRSLTEGATRSLTIGSFSMPGKSTPCWPS